MVGTLSLSSGARSRDPLALPTLRSIAPLRTQPSSIGQLTIHGVPN
jgi:hypothetical protein